MAKLFSRKKEDSAHYLSGYRVENLRSNRPVVVSEQSLIVGDIYAPQVIIKGMVYGYIVAASVTIEPAGQVWGDICATSIDILPGSKVHGWISTIDQGTVDLLRLGQLTVEEIPNSGEFATTADVARTLDEMVPEIADEREKSAERVEIWRKLQAEAAAAISARIEIENTFTTRVHEAAGTLKSPAYPRSGLAEDGGNMTPPDSELGNQLENAAQLAEAEAEINQLRTQLAALLRRQIHLRNRLLWTKASLQQAMEQQPTSSLTADPGQPCPGEQVRGEELAGLQATIVERDLKIEKLRKIIATREEQLSRIKSLAAKRIETLEDELAELQKGQT